MPWISHTGPRHRQAAKFTTHARLGTDKSAGGQYRGWHYSFTAHSTGSGVQRTRYSVSILDNKKHRVAYLRDFSSIEQATRGAKDYIDQKLGFDMQQKSAANVGTIPKLPTSKTVENLPAQEK